MPWKRGIIELISKKDLKDIKDDLRELVSKIEALQEHDNIDKLTINWDKKEIESPGVTIGCFLPRLQWFNKRLDKWIEKAPAGKRGPKKKGVIEEIQDSIEQMDEGLGIPVEVVKENIKKRRSKNNNNVSTRSH